MIGLRRVARRVRALVGRRAAERELDDELRFHLEMEAAHRGRQGLSPAEAEAAARRVFGGVERFKEACRDVRGVRVVEDGVQDVRYAVRALRRTPGFVLVAVVTIALGIGANTAIMSAIQTLLLAPLPYANADRLVKVGVTKAHGKILVDATPQLVQTWRTRGQVVEQVAALQVTLDTFRLGGQPDEQSEVLRGAAIDATLPALLGVRPVFGRTFLRTDASAGAPPVAMIGYRLWQRRFGGRADVLGRVVRANSHPYTIVGVMPRDFDLFLGGRVRYQVWTPLLPSTRGIPVSAIARLRPGATVAQANSELRTLITALGQDDAQYRGMAPNVRSLSELRGSGDRDLLLLLAGATGFVLLIACANVANLLLARGLARQHELSIRTALGAGRGRIVRQLLTESTLLALLGGAAGLVVAWAALHLILALRPDTMMRELDRVRLEPVMLVWGLALSVGTGLLFGLAPAFFAARNGLGASLTGAARSVAGQGRSRRFRSALMAAEVALAVVLLVGAGLWVRTVRAIEQFDPGFDTHGLVTMRVTLPEGTYQTAAQRTAAYDALLDQVRALPGAASATLALEAPPDAALAFGDLEIDGRAMPPGVQVSLLNANDIQPSYLTVIGLRLLVGRVPVADTSAHEVLINRTMARRYWPKGGAVGQRLRRDHAAPWSVVVGVVDDVRSAEQVAIGRDLWIYYPFTGALKWATLIIRTHGDTPALVRQVVSRAATIDPAIRVDSASTVDQELARGTRGIRYALGLLGTFALLALALAAVGLYGVVAYAVTQRTREMGIRVALGARPASVVRLVLGQGLRFTVVGLALGLASAAALTRVMRSMLFGVTPLDPVTFAGVALLLAAVAAVASYLPARRASRVDPAVTLRAE